jgi:hypothetical protein
MPRTLHDKERRVKSGAGNRRKASAVGGMVGRYGDASPATTLVLPMSYGMDGDQNADVEPSSGHRRHLGQPPYFQYDQVKYLNSQGLLGMSARHPIEIGRRPKPGISLVSRTVPIAG